MKYMLTWSVKPENQKESIKRWKEKGSKSPEGIEVLSHYWNVNHLNGWAVFKASNHATVAKWLLNWTDLNVNEVTPIIDDEEMHSIVGKNLK